MTGTDTRHVLVVGAGMVGISTGLALRREGWAVTVVDPGPPGGETSSGNAGVIARGTVVPINPPALWRSLPRILAGRHPGARVDWRYALAEARFMAGLLANATPARCRRSEAALNALLDGAPAAHAGLMADAGEAHRLRRTGWLKLYPDARTFAAADRERAALARFGIDHAVLDGEAIAEREPHLTQRFSHGLWVRAAASVDDPGAVVAAYATLLTAQGGRLVSGRVRALSPAPVAAHLVDGRILAADHIVVAAGPWSGDLLRPLGVRLPLGMERGTSRLYAARGNAVLNRPILDVAGGYALAPMAAGIRLTTGADFSARDRPQRFRQLSAAEGRARILFPLDGPADPAPWAGSRTSLPDGRPAIGRVPGHPAIWCSTGHGHIGFSSGPTSAALLAALMAGRPPPFDATAFDPGRFA